MNLLKLSLVLFGLFVVLLDTTVQVIGSGAETWRAPQGRGRTGFNTLNVYGGNADSINASESAKQFEAKTYAVAAAATTTDLPSVPSTSNYNQSINTNSSKSS